VTESTKGRGAFTLDGVTAMVILLGILTMAKSAEIEEKGGTPPMERVITAYLKRMNITVKQ